MNVTGVLHYLVNYLKINSSVAQACCHFVSVASCGAVLIVWCRSQKLLLHFGGRGIKILGQGSCRDLDPDVEVLKADLLILLKSTL